MARKYASDENDGAYNTDKIVEISPAAQWCREKGKDWYLPAKSELSTIYKNKSTLNARLSAIGGTTFDTGYYWSSTEDDRRHAYYIDFDSGNVYSSYKDSSYYVRAVRAL